MFLKILDDFDFESAKKLSHICLYFESNVFCNPPYYLTPSARLPGNPEKVYDACLAWRGLFWLEI